MSAMLWIAVALGAAAFLYGFVRHFMKRGTEVVQSTALGGFERRFPNDPEVATLAALALHPFDGKKVPSRPTQLACTMNL